LEYEWMNVSEGNWSRKGNRKEVGLRADTRRMILQDSTETFEGGKTHESIKPAFGNAGFFLGGCSACSCPGGPASASPSSGLLETLSDLTRVLHILFTGAPEDHTARHAADGNRNVQLTRNAEEIVFHPDGAELRS
jgi:hypothetical protein